MLALHQRCDLSTQDDLMLSIPSLEELFHRDGWLKVKRIDQELKCRLDKSVVTLGIQVEAILTDVLSHQG